MGNQRIDKYPSRKVPSRTRDSPFSPRPFAVPAQQKNGSKKTASQVAAEAQSPNRTSLAGNLKSGVECLSCTSLGGVVQRTKTRDYGGVQTNQWYREQIKATGTADIIRAVDKSMSKSGESGIFVSDDLLEMQQWLNFGGNSDVHQIVLPDMKAFTSDEKLMLSTFGDNGLGPQRNCEIIAEHELTHLKHAAVNLQQQNFLGARTAATSFNAVNIIGTVDGLLNEAKKLYTFKEGQEVTRLSKAVKHIDQRLQYIKATWTNKNSNAEAPAVMRELSRYLADVVKPNDTKDWAQFTERIEALDAECSKSIGMDPAKKKGCFLTSACVSSRRLPDQCEELTVLRAFRDGYLHSLSEGSALIDQYYEVAPRLVKIIDSRPNREEIYDEIYTVVQFCVQAIHNGAHLLALQAYQAMVSDLSQRFGVARGPQEPASRTVGPSLPGTPGRNPRRPR